MKIQLPLNCLEQWKMVEAEIVDVAPHLAATFALHRGEVFGLGKWAVSDVETGNHVSCFGNTKAEVIEKATKLLANKTQQDTENAWRKAMRNKMYALGRGEAA
jgi:hypothetical protein